MAKLIKIHDIDQFFDVVTIQDAAVNQTIISNIRNLDEKSELEQFTREILYDPNETAHGPTEIADILTTHVNVKGKKNLSAFVLKGKSYRKVSSKDVAHQFAKLRQIPKLGLMVFGAIGDIQDNAKRDFQQCAIDTACDYLIIDAHDWARLFIAYEKICPKDGTVFDYSGACKSGHIRDKGLTLEMEVREKIRYSILTQRDVSHAGAKRYSSVILLDKHYPKETIREIIKEITEILKFSNYYRNERVRARWGKIPANAVWLFIAYDLEDVQNANWVCRTCWIDPTMNKDMKPEALEGNEKLEDIEIRWNDEYQIHKSIFEEHYGSKEKMLEVIKPILKEMANLARQGILLFKDYECGNLSEEDFISKMQKLEPKASELYDKSGNIPLPPDDCKDYEKSCQSIFATIHNMFIYYTEIGLETWPKQNRDWLMQNTIKRFYDDLKIVEFEEKKLH